eukprot:gene3463-6889_t
MASNVLSSIDNAAKETLEEPKVSATAIRSKRRMNEPSIQTDSQEVSDSTNLPSSEDVTGSNNSIIDINVESTISDGLPVRNRGTAAVENVVKEITIKNDTNHETKKKIIAKEKEIERLNGECLELEDKCDALKREVEEAWITYKTSQEKSAAREQELQDEIRQLQKAKQTDKQQSLSHFQKLGEDAEDALKQLRTVQQEKEAIATQLRQLLESSAEWQARELSLQAEVLEVRSTSQQAISSVREELRVAETAMSELRNQHAQLMRHSHSRQTELERDNAELTASITDKAREIQRLQRLLGSEGREPGHGRETDGLRQQLDTTLSELDEERERVVQWEKRVRTLDCEYRAAQIMWDDERQQHANTLQLMTTQISDLQSRLQEEEAARALCQRERTGAAGPLGAHSPAPKDPVVVLEQQVGNLSQQLLRRQGLVENLQAERASLKVRLNDMHIRCERLEKQLVRQDDDEDGDNGDDDVEEGKSLMTSSSQIPTSLQDTTEYNRSNEDSGVGGDRLNRRRRLASAPSSKMISEFERIGVKPNVHVAQAVTMIDTWTLLTGRFLRSYPLLRLSFVLYLLGLHLWVLLILVIHTHSLDDMRGGGNGRVPAGIMPRQPRAMMPSR